jgi:hypothetical protein
MIKLSPHLDDQLHSFVNFKTFEVVYVYHVLPVYPEKYLGIQFLLKVVKAFISQILIAGFIQNMNYHVLCIKEHYVLERKKYLKCSLPH